MLVKQIVSVSEKEIFAYSDIKYQKTDILRPHKNQNVGFVKEYVG